MRAGISVIVMVMFLMFSEGAQAEEGLGIGIILGEPTGITIKKWISKDRAIDAAAAWSFSDNASFQLHADYLAHDFGVLSTGTVGGRLPVYFGVGGRFKVRNKDNNSLLGVRIPFGISYLFAKAPAELFAEIVPILDVVPDTRFGLNGAIGARFYFK